MIEKSDLKSYLEHVGENHPHHVLKKINKGDLIKKSVVFGYIIDDADIDKKLGDFPEGAIPYGPIYRTLKFLPEKVFDLFRMSSTIPFSDAYNAGIGECLEKSILAQLSAQRGRDSFLISGVLEVNGGFVEAHAYNIVFRNSKPFLLDIENPLALNSEGKVTHPYIAPILGVNEKTSDIILPEEWRQGRTYSIL